MALVRTVLGTPDEFDSPSATQAIAARTFTNGRPITVWVFTAAASPSPTPTVTASSGLTVTEIDSIETDSGSVRRRVTAFDAYPSSTGSVTLTINTSGGTDHLYVDVWEWTGGVNVVDYVAQTDTGQGNTSGSVTGNLSAFQTGSAAAMGAVIKPAM